ncbi:hypothetical protein LTS17_012367 [Exophiala oligosperma]
MLKTLNIPRKQKYSLLAVFAVGGLLQCVYCGDPTSTCGLRYQQFLDPTYDNVAAAYWSSIELNTGIGYQFVHRILKVLHVQ